MKKYGKILLTGGGTAGHVMPNVALLPHLAEHFNEIHYIGTNGMEKDIMAGYPSVVYHTISATKLDRSGGLKNLLIPFRLVKSVCEARRVLKFVKPCLVFSKGGFVALPVALAAKCPVITHESDMSLGLANRIAAKKSSKLLSIFPISHKKAVAVGAPLRNNLFNGSGDRAINQLNFSHNKPILLVMGGSLGARAINSALRDALPKLSSTFNIAHLTGRGGRSELLESGSYRQIEFANNIGDLYAAASVVVSRAGAGSVTELAALKKPTLLIPLPKGNSRGDQLENAAYMQKQGLMRVTHQPLSAPKLCDEILKTYENRDKLTSALEKVQFNGTARIVEVILSVAESGK